MSGSDGLGKPLALLGRPGPARERLREALSMVGAEIVLEDDPSAIDVQALTDAQASVVLVVLEPAIEDAIEALDPALNAPGVTLIFEEADIALRREGWEAQRWARHLAAKLHGHHDVLPPGGEVEPALQPVPGLPVSPAQLHEQDPLDVHLSQAAGALDTVPADAMFGGGNATPPVGAAAPAFEPAEPVPPTAVEPPAAAVQPSPMAVGDSSTWGLVEDYSAPAVPTEATSEVGQGEISTEGLSLVDLDEDTGPVGGAILVMAGIGGPDAIRRLLAALPAQFPRPVLVQMTLDGGQYGNLVRQMGRVSALPVALAESGQQVQPGQVYILPDEVGLCVDHGALHFGDALDLVTSLQALPLEDSAVLMLSGANEALVEDVLTLAGKGMWVAGQAADGCYAPAAAARLVAKGMSSGDPVQLSQALAERWKS